MSRIGQAQGCGLKRSAAPVLAISSALPEHAVRFRFTCLMKSNVELSRSRFSKGFG